MDTRDAWKCLGMMLIFWVLVSLIVAAVGKQFPQFHHWVRQGFGVFVTYTVGYSLFILTALYFGRVESLETFLRAFALNRRPSSFLWFALVATLLLRGIGHLLNSSGVSRWGVFISSIGGFIHGAGLESYFYVAPILMAPFCEEIFMRGFLYRAFRGTYPVLVSTAILVVISCVMHIDQILHSVFAIIFLSAITVLLCFLREQKDSLWDCIICHFVFNLSGVLVVFLHSR